MNIDDNLGRIWEITRELKLEMLSEDKLLKLLRDHQNSWRGRIYRFTGGRFYRDYKITERAIDESLRSIRNPRRECYI